MGLGNMVTLTTLRGEVETQSRWRGWKSDQERQRGQHEKTGHIGSLAVNGASPRGRGQSHKFSKDETF